MQRMVEGLKRLAPSVSPAGCHLPIALRQGGFFLRAVTKIGPRGPIGIVRLLL
jgi:hypothetical protein